MFALRRCLLVQEQHVIEIKKVCCLLALGGTGEGKSLAALYYLKRHTSPYRRQMCIINITICHEAIRLASNPSQLTGFNVNITSFTKERKFNT